MADSNTGAEAAQRAANGRSTKTFANLEAARLSVFKYVETIYNPLRRRQTLGYKSPDQFEAK